MTALLVVLLLSSACFLVARPVAAKIISERLYGQLCAAFLALTICAFLAPTIWVYLAALVMVCAVLIGATQKQALPLCCAWAMLLLAVPAAPAQVPGFGGLEHLVTLTHIRALNCLLLLPVAWRLMRQGTGPRFGRLPTDWFVLGYLVVQMTMTYGTTTTTNWARLSLYLLIDVWLVYWCISRAFRDAADVYPFFLSLTVGLCANALVAVVEVTRTWPIYEAVTLSWNLKWDLAIWLTRNDLLRAKAAAGHSLVLGFSLVVAFSVYLAVMRRLGMRPSTLGLALMLFFGLLSSLARGAWLGLACVLVATWLLSPKAGRLTVIGVGLAIVLGSVLSLLPQTREVIAYLPFVGTVDTENIDYRARLMEVSLALLAQSPWLGVPDYLSQMEELRQGQGIIDVVNSYLGIALAYGALGLTLFLGAVLVPAVGLWQVRRNRDTSPEQESLVRALLAALVAVGIMLGTMSTIAAIVPLLWMVVACAANVAAQHRLRNARGKHASVLFGPLAA